MKKREVRATHKIPAIAAAIALAAGLTGTASAGTVPLAGLNWQYHYISPSSFMPVATALAPACAMKYVAGSSSGFFRSACTDPVPASYVAPLNLPEGSIVGGMYVWYYDNSQTGQMDIYLSRATKISSTTPNVNLANYDSTPGNLLFRSGVSTADTSSHMGWIPANPYFTFDSWGMQGVFRTNYHHDIFVKLSGNDPDVGFGGVMFSYMRQIAPAPASATYEDISTSHPFFNEIEQLSKAGITLGCGNNQFCPDSPVTRGQMAAFLSRALGLQWDMYTDAAS